MSISNVTPSSDNSITRAETAYRSIRDAILSNRLQTGEPLREESIAQQLGMSRTPVREALGRLRQEGLVKEAKPRGYIVSAVSELDVFHVYAVREELEAFNHRLAATQITSHQLFQLSTIIQQMEQAVDDPHQFSNLNRRFHQIIFAASGNPVLAKIMDDLMAVVDRFPVSAYEIEGRSEAVVEEHKVILDALHRHDSEAAQEAARHHLRVGLDARLAALQRHALSTLPTKAANL